MATAFELIQTATQADGPAFEVDIFEKDSRAGGNIRTERDSGYVCEWGPEGFLDSVPETLSLAERVGLSKRTVRASQEADKRYILRDGRLRNVPVNPASFLFSDLMPLKPRLRVMMEPFIPAKKDTSDETVFDFASRRIGRGAAERLVDAMVSGVFAGDARRLSLPAAFPKMAEMERQYGGLVRAMIGKMREAKKNGAKVGSPSGPRGKLTSFRGGLESLVESLVESIGAERIHFGKEAHHIELTESNERNFRQTQIYHSFSLRRSRTSRCRSGCHTINGIYIFV